MTDPSPPADPPRPCSVPRFDPAHGEASPLPEPEAAAPSDSVLQEIAGRGPGAGQQLEQQATELATHLQRRQHALARRTAMLNARSAENDSQQRAARLWLREQQTTLDRREKECQRQNESSQRQPPRQPNVERSAEMLEREKEQVAQLKRLCEQKRDQLDREFESLRHEVTWLEAERTSWRTQCQEERRTLDELRRQLLDQQQATEQLNRELREQLQQQHDAAGPTRQLAHQQRSVERETARQRQEQLRLEELAESLQRDRELWRSQTAEQRRAIATRWRRRRRRLAKLHDALQARQQALQEQEDDLRQLQEELQRQRRELTQRQIVLQHAHATLARQVSPEQLAHLEQVVQRFVTAEFELAERTLATRKHELQELAASLQQQQELLKIRHRRFHTHMARREQALAEQARNETSPALATRGPLLVDRRTMGNDY